MRRSNIFKLITILLLASGFTTQCYITDITVLHNQNSDQYIIVCSDIHWEDPINQLQQEKLQEIALQSNDDLHFIVEDMGWERDPEESMILGLESILQETNVKVTNIEHRSMIFSAIEHAQALYKNPELLNMDLLIKKESPQEYNKKILRDNGYICAILNDTSTQCLDELQSYPTSFASCECNYNNLYNHIKQFPFFLFEALSQKSLLDFYTDYTDQIIKEKMKQKGYTQPEWHSKDLILKNFKAMHTTMVDARIINTLFQTDCHKVILLAGREHTQKAVKKLKMIGFVQAIETLGKIPIEQDLESGCISQMNDQNKNIYHQSTKQVKRELRKLMVQPVQLDDFNIILALP